MFFFNSGFGKNGGKAKRGIGKASAAVAICAWATLHLLAFTVLVKFPAEAVKPSPELSIILSGAYAVVISMMLSSGIKSSVAVLFERGDLDLLLCSPLSSRSIFTVRLAGIVVAVGSIYLFLFAPVGNVGLALGQYRWLGIYPVVIGTAAIAASFAMLFTLGLVRLFGVRRTRVIAQVIGALSGALFFLLSQVYANSGEGLRDRMNIWFAPMFAPGAALGPDSAIWWPAKALLGDPRGLLVMSVLAIGVFWLTVHFTHQFFVSGMQGAASTARVATAPSGGPRYQFGRSLTSVVVIKEWRLIARDPQLISQVLLQLLYMLPLCLVLFRQGVTLPGIGASLTYLCGSLTTSLAWVIIAAEDAPGLLRAAPGSLGTIRRAKLAAVVMPALAIVSIPLLWLMAHAPIGALLMCATAVASVMSSALVAMWCGRPALRGEFKMRAKGNFLGNTLELLNGFAWAGLAYLLLTISAQPQPSMAMLLSATAMLPVALLILLFGWLCRHRED
jgi:ABC-2 type transport system permease protein